MADTLTEYIEQGRFTVGERLPPESELCQTYNVSRFTVREAVRLLQQDGLVTTRRGVGSIVINNKRGNSIYRFESDDAGDFLNSARNSRLERLTLTIGPASKAVAQGLGVDEGSMICKVQALRRSTPDGVVLGYTELYLQEHHQEILPNIGQQPRPIAEMIEERFGVVAGEIEQIVTPVRLNKVAASWLEVRAGHLGLLTQRRYFDREQSVYLYVRLTAIDESAKLTMRLHRH